MTCAACQSDDVTAEVHHPSGVAFSCTGCALDADWTDLLGTDCWSFWALPTKDVT